MFQDFSASCSRAAVAGLVNGYLQTFQRSERRTQVLIKIGSPGSPSTGLYKCSGSHGRTRAILTSPYVPLHKLCSFLQLHWRYLCGFWLESSHPRDSSVFFCSNFFIGSITSAHKSKKQDLRQHQRPLLRRNSNSGFRNGFRLRPLSLASIPRIPFM
jgi:hypothetical protein